MPEREPSYHHGNLREFLIAAAYQVVEANGPEAVSMRALARSLDVSSSAPFRHFEDKPALIDAVAERAAKVLGNRIEEAVAGCDDALTEFRARTVAYVRFAAEHPRLFDLIHTRGHGPGRVLGLAEDERRLKLSALIVEGQNAGLLPEADPELIILTNEALTHGLARMIVDGHPHLAALSSESARRLALAATQLLQSGIGLS